MVNGHTSMFFSQFYKGKQLNRLPVCFSEGQIPLGRRVYILKRKNLLSELSPIEKRDKNEIGKVASPGKVPIYLKLSDVGAPCAVVLHFMGHETDNKIKLISNIVNP